MLKDAKRFSAMAPPSLAWLWAHLHVAEGDVDGVSREHGAT